MTQSMKLRTNSKKLCPVAKQNLTDQEVQFFCSIATEEWLILFREKVSVRLYMKKRIIWDEMNRKKNSLFFTDFKRNQIWHLFL